MPTTAHKRQPHPLRALRPISKTNNEPRSVQVAQRLLEVANESPDPEVLLPNQHELARMLGVSLATVRQALMTLRVNGKIVTVPSVGTFVRKTSKLDLIQAAMRQPFTTLDDLAGQRLHSTLVSSGIVPISGNVRGLSGKESFHFEWRVLGPEAQPVACIQAWALPQYGRRVSQAGSFGDVLVVLRDVIEHADVLIGSRAPGEKERIALGVQPFEGALYMELQVRDHAGKPVLYSEWVANHNLALESRLGWAATRRSARS